MTFCVLSFSYFVSIFIIQNLQQFSRSVTTFFLLFKKSETNSQLFRVGRTCFRAVVEETTAASCAPLDFPPRQDTAG